jgi:hypothetical protein
MRLAWIVVAVVLSVMALHVFPVLSVLRVIVRLTMMGRVRGVLILLHVLIITYFIMRA